ncbi:MAG: efflux transporter outer membrane subunit [Pelomonas sp.]|nr:efflux transporter outer membrane subunit [Roseateles sp.]
MQTQALRQRQPSIGRPAIRVAVLSSCLALCACAVGPDFQAPQKPAGAGYAVGTAGADLRAGTAADAQRFVMGRDVPFAWWEQFQSPKLDALVARALRANPVVPAAEAALRQAQEYASAQSGYFYPSVGLGLSAQRQKAAVDSGSPGIYALFTSQLTLAYTPDLFGANRRQVEALQAEADMQRFQNEATYVTLVDNLVAAVIQAASLRDQIDATRALIGQNHEGLRVLRDQVRLGYAMGIDLATQEQATAQAEAALPPLDKQYQQTLDLVRALCGALPNEDLDVDLHLADLHLPQELPLSLPADLLDQRPDVRAAAAQLHAASAKVGVAVAARIPQLTISGAAGGSAYEFSRMFKSGGPMWNMLAGLTQPVFDGGTLRHEQRAAEQGLAQARAQYESAVVAAFQNLADTLHAIRADAAALDSTARAEQAAARIRDLTSAQQQRGYVSLLGLLQAQENYEQAHLALLQAQTNRLGDTAALFQALGGGWWHRAS